jgi:thiamine-monophosphate kinase
LVARLGQPRPGAGRTVIVGPGDDAAVVRPARRPLLLTTDALIEAVHFRRGWTTPAALGRRAFGVNASDLAAMGGLPRFALLALEAPARLEAAHLDAIVTGFAAAARRAGAWLVGGNLAAGPHLAITAMLVGEAPGRVVTRAGGRAGDLVYLTGTLGAAGLAVRRLRARRPAHLPEPPPRLAAGVALAAVASAMIDVSDGLLQDLGHLCRASGVGAEVALARLPVAPACRRALGARAAAFAATAGEDYELLVAVPPARTRMLGRLAPRLRCRITPIGRLVAGRAGVRVSDHAGHVFGVRHAGFDHFRR